MSVYPRLRRVKLGPNAGQFEREAAHRAARKLANEANAEVAIYTARFVVVARVQPVVS